MKYLSAITACIILVIMAFTWSKLSIDANALIPVPEQIIAIGKYIIAAGGGGVVGNLLKK